MDERIHSGHPMHISRIRRVGVCFVLNDQPGTARHPGFSDDAPHLLLEAP